jgi:hypothetical protein
MSASPIGTLVSRQNIEQAYINLLKTWITSTYLLDVAAQNNITPALPNPPLPESYYGGVDGQSWQEIALPSLIVLAQPDGDPQLRGSGDYSQWYEVQVLALVKGDDPNFEDDARALADWYAIAILGAVLQNGDLNGLAVQTLLVEPGRTEFVDDDRREFAQSTVTFKTLIDSVVNRNYSPPAPGYPQSAVPTVATTNLEPNGSLLTVPIDEPLA